MGSRFIAIVLAAGLAGIASAAPPNMSVANYLERKKQISAEHRTAQAACGADLSSGREICLAEAASKDVVAKADLEVAYRSTPRTRYEASEARADARFWVARERCADAARLNRDACVRDAKTVRLAAQAEGTVLMKAAEAQYLIDESCANGSATAEQRRMRACKAAATRDDPAHGTK